MADNGRLTVDQKVKAVLFLRRNKECSRDSETLSCTLWYMVCSLQTDNLQKQFETNGSVLEKKRPRPASVRTPANIEAVCVALIRSPSKSTRRASAELGISRRSLQTILHSDLYLYLFPYKITVMHKLTAIDKERRLPERHEGGKFWPPHSPDINPCDFFLWGFLKEKVFQRRPENVAQLRAHTGKLCRALSEDLCRKIVTNAMVRLQEVVRQNGGHIEHVVQ